MKSKIHQNENEATFATTKENELWNKNENITMEEQISPYSSKTVDSERNENFYVVPEKIIETVLTNTERKKNLLEENKNNEEIINTQEKANGPINQTKKMESHLEYDDITTAITNTTTTTPTTTPTTPTTPVNTTAINTSINTSINTANTTTILESNYILYSQNKNKKQEIISVDEADITQNKTESDPVVYDDKLIQNSVQTENRNSKSKNNENNIKDNINNEEQNAQENEINIKIENAQLEIQKQDFDEEQSKKKDANIEKENEKENEKEEEKEKEKENKKTQYFILYDEEEEKQEQEQEQKKKQEDNNSNTNSNLVPNYNFSLNDFPHLSVNVVSNSNSSSCVTKLNEFVSYDDFLDLENLSLSNGNLKLGNSISKDELLDTNMDGKGKKEVEYYKLNSTTDCSVSLCSSGKAMYEGDYNTVLKKLCNVSSSKESSCSDSFSVVSLSNSKIASQCRMSFPKFASTGNVIVTSRTVTKQYIENGLKSTNYNYNDSNSIISSNNRVSTTCADFYKSCDLFPFKKRLTHSKRAHIMNWKNINDGNARRMFLSTNGLIDIYQHTKVSQIYWGNNNLQESHPLHYIRRNRNDKLFINGVPYHINNQLRNNMANSIGTTYRSTCVFKAKKTYKKKKHQKIEYMPYNCNCFNYKKIYNDCINFIDQVKKMFYFCVPNKNYLNESDNEQIILNNGYMNYNVYTMYDDKRLIPIVLPKNVYSKKRKNNDTFETIKQTA